MEQISLLLTAFLFGGMLLFSVGFGPLVLKNLEGSVARLFIRNTFPHFYLFVLASSFLAAATVFTTTARSLCCFTGYIFHNTSGSTDIDARNKPRLR